MPTRPTAEAAAALTRPTTDATVEPPEYPTRG
jgi:hypothetical protein